MNKHSWATMQKLSQDMIDKLRRHGLYPDGPPIQTDPPYPIPDFDEDT